MKTIIAGSRNITKMNVLKTAIKQADFDITKVVSGCARGVDELGIRWAKKNNIPIKKFPAEWDVHGRAAGIIRNIEMAKYADALIAIWDGKSRGTLHMIREANKRSLEVYIHLQRRINHE